MSRPTSAANAPSWPAPRSGVPDPLPRVIQIIPYDGIGGVEIAAASVPAGTYDRFVFGKAFLASKSDRAAEPGRFESGRPSENDPLAYARTLRHLLAQRPAVVVASLWRSCLVAIGLKLLRPRTRIVVFLHNIRHANVVDRLVTQLAVRMASALWADSPSTAALRLGPAFAPRTRAVSFLTARLEPVALSQPAPRFITWGRLHPRKRIDRAVALFARVRAARPDARFTVIGPDHGERPRLEAQAAALGIAASVDFAGPADLPQICARSRDHAFFLQTSRFEGMGMAAVEAMQLGLVPVVTPVGEVGVYVRDGVNGLWIGEDDAGAVAAVLALLGDPPRFRAMQEAAIATWRDRPLYREEFLAACADLLDADGGGAGRA